MKKIGDLGLTVVKSLFSHRERFFSQAAHVPAAVFLVECGVGPLPGGYAWTWDFSLITGFAKSAPLGLAGGLAIDNVRLVIEQCQPAAVDISSGVEHSPGKKDIHKVKQFIAAVRKVRTARSNRRIFYVNHGPDES